MNRKNYRTPRWWIAGKMTIAVWIVLGSFNWLFSTDFFSFWTTAITIYCWMWGMSFVVQFIGFVLFGQEAEYKKCRKAGWHPYWDQIPPPFNNDTHAVKGGGIPKPKTDFTPPDDWSKQCMRCGARNEDWATQCWECKATFVAGPPPTPDPRYCYCPHCNKKFFENKYGDLDNGILCPYCQQLCRSKAGEDALRAQQ